MKVYIADYMFFELVTKQIIWVESGCGFRASDTRYELY